MKVMKRVSAVLIVLWFLSSCGYHIAGTSAPPAPPAAAGAKAPAATPAAGIPKNVHTIAIEPFHNGTQRPDIPRLLSSNITREFISRTHYKVVADPKQADAVLAGAIGNFMSFSTTADPVTGRSTGAEVILQLNIYLTEKSGKSIFQRTGYEFRERYEISENVSTYFDESGTAIQRVTRDAARSIVTAILENF